MIKIPFTKTKIYGILGMLGAFAAAIPTLDYFGIEVPRPLWVSEYKDSSTKLNHKLTSIELKLVTMELTILNSQLDAQNTSRAMLDRDIAKKNRDGEEVPALYISQKAEISNSIRKIMSKIEQATKRKLELDK